MSTIRPRPGFDPSKLNWGAPDQPQSDDCSYCGDAIPDDAVPLRMWNAEGWAVVFCDTCTETWFGMQGFEDPVEPRPEPEARRKRAR